MQFSQRLWGSGGRGWSSIPGLHPGLQNHLKPMKTNKYHKYLSLAAMQFSQRLWGSGRRARSTTRQPPGLHPGLQNHLKPMKTNIYHKYLSFAANITNITVWQLCNSLKGYGGLGEEHPIQSQVCTLASKTT